MNMNNTVISGGEKEVTLKVTNPSDYSKVRDILTETSEKISKIKPKESNLSKTLRMVLSHGYTRILLYSSRTEIDHFIQHDARNFCSMVYQRVSNNFSFGDALIWLSTGDNYTYAGIEFDCVIVTKLVSNPTRDTFRFSLRYGDNPIYLEI